MQVCVVGSGEECQLSRAVSAKAKIVADKINWPRYGEKRKLQPRSRSHKVQVKSLELNVRAASIECCHQAHGKEVVGKEVYGLRSTG